MKYCLICKFKGEYDKKDASRFLRNLKLCRKHTKELEENNMECSFCGSQSTTFVKGTSKKTGKPWSAYDCDEASCKNDKGYPNRTFVPFGPKSPATGFKSPSNGPSKSPQSTPLEKKVDQILSILKAKFSSELTASEMTGNTENEEDQNPF